MKKNIMIIPLFYVGFLFSSESEKHECCSSRSPEIVEYKSLRKRTADEIKRIEYEQGLPMLRAMHSYYDCRVTALTVRERVTETKRECFASVKTQGPISKL